MFLDAVCFLPLHALVIVFQGISATRKCIIFGEWHQDFCLESKKLCFFAGYVCGQSQRWPPDNGQHSCCGEYAFVSIVVSSLQPRRHSSWNPVLNPPLSPPRLVGCDERDELLLLFHTTFGVHVDELPGPQQPVRNPHSSRDSLGLQGPSADQAEELETWCWRYYWAHV